MFQLLHVDNNYSPLQGRIKLLSEPQKLSIVTSVCLRPLAIAKLLCRFYSNAAILRDQPYVQLRKQVFYHNL